MNLLPVDLASLLPSLPQIGGKLSIVAGDLSKLVSGEVVTATLDRSSPGQAVLRLPGTSVTVQLLPGVAIDPRAPLLVRVSSQSGAPSLEVLGDLIPSPAAGSGSTSTKPVQIQRDGVAPAPTNPEQAGPGRTLSREATASVVKTPNSSNPDQTTSSTGTTLRPRESVPAIIRQSADGQFSLEITGRSIPVKGEGLTPGQSVLVRWGPPLAAAGRSLSTDATSTRPSLATTPNSSTGTRALPDTARTSAPVPTPLVRAEILKALPDGRFTVRVDGRPLTVAVVQSNLGDTKAAATNTSSPSSDVASEQPLSVGSKVLGRIESTPEGPVLRLDAPETAAPREVATTMLRDIPQRLPLGTSLQTTLQSLPQLMQSAGQDAPLVKNIQQLQSVLTEIVAPANQPPASDKLEQFVRNGGLHFEAKLARVVSGEAPADHMREAAEHDVKGQLLNVLSSAAKSPSLTSDARALDPVRQALDGIEAQQMLNVLARSGGEPMQIQFPLAATGPWQTLQLSIHPDDQSGSSGENRPREYNVLMHLDMTELGATWIDARASGKNLRATLYIENESGREKARSNIGLLNQALQDVGFANVLVDVRATADLPSGQAAERFHALETGVPQSVSLVDRSA